MSIIALLMSVLQLYLRTKVTFLICQKWKGINRAETFKLKVFQWLVFEICELSIT